MSQNAVHEAVHEAFQAHDVDFAAFIGQHVGETKDLR